MELGCLPPAAGSADNEMSHLHSSAGPGGPGPGWRDMASQDRRQVQLFLADPGTENPMGSGTLTPRLVEHNGTSRFIWFNLHIGEMRKLKSTEGTTITELIAAKLEREARPLNPRPVRFPWGQQHSNSFCGILCPNKTSHSVKQRESRASWWRLEKDRPRSPTFPQWPPRLLLQTPGLH